MPNRIIKDSIRTSKNVNSLSDFQFRLWIYLITYVDDYGRGSADPELLKGFVFPRRRSATESQIASALTELANIGMINLYEVDGESYFCFPNWGEHQRIQSKKAKFPNPPWATVSHGESPSEYESNTNTNPNTNPNPNIGTASGENAAAVLSLTCNTGEEFPVFQAQVDEWSGLFPAVDVMQELRNMKAWCDANPTKRKTRGGMPRFIVSWLSKEQNKGGTQAATRGKYTAASRTQQPIDMAEVKAIYDKI